ncbi:hypothetical protein CROQUDRAFT_301278 [Cronartium quercuum f. sp. fusiforme G11]|uniref:Uncharacterized protein n=1 Tax=Cronartium quercuum f. sp. fusiforme G11 TaxID=708437 RepID=A0A9P6TGA9_9BASI|nr:hypothetical protein CROQUDRAFT_301278 [Cronartium quercuum f. sp. fusiforme G11]
MLPNLVLLHHFSQDSFFIFEYSSKAVLEAKGLIAHRVAPPPPPPPRPPPNFNPNSIVKKESKTLKGDFAEIGYAAAYLTTLWVLLFFLSSETQIDSRARVHLDRRR